MLTIQGWSFPDPPPSDEWEKYRAAKTRPFSPARRLLCHPNPIGPFACVGCRAPVDGLRTIYRSADSEALWVREAWCEGCVVAKTAESA